MYLPDESVPPQHNGYELDRVFNIKRQPLKEYILNHIYRLIYVRDCRIHIFCRVARQKRENPNYDFDKNMLDSDKRLGVTFLFGGWHSEKYTQAIRDKIRSTFRFDEGKASENTLRVLEQMSGIEDTCSIHVRRGDYLNSSLWLGCATENYYQAAIKKMRQHGVKNFYLFSNDIKWCRQKFDKEGFHYVAFNKEKDSWQDMFLMSRCKHHICANSTFSWWGAWLGEKEDSIVIVPEKFMSDRITKDIYPDRWIKM